MYLHGTNVQRNPLEAYNWFALAAECGQVPAVAERDKLKSALTREQLEQASRWLEQRRSRWFRNR
jgi:TPR repeat protein